MEGVKCNGFVTLEVYLVMGCTVVHGQCGVAGG